MRCIQESCQAAAQFMVYWPGRLPLPMCEAHKQAAQRVGEAIGCYIPCEPLALSAATPDAGVQ